MGGLVHCCYKAVIPDDQPTQYSEEFWNSEPLRQLRLNSVSGVKSSECATCWRQEGEGGKSLRAGSLDTNYSRYSGRERVSLLREDGSMPDGISNLEISFSNTCAMQCRTCNPYSSSQWALDSARGGALWPFLKSNGYVIPIQRKLSTADTHADKIFQLIRAQGENLRFVYFNGGEPLADPLHWEVLNLLKEHAPRISLRYFTSLEGLPEGVLNHWADFRSVDLEIALDGDRETYNYVRHGGHIENVMTNVQRIQERFAGRLSAASEEHEEAKGMVMKALCTVSRYNVDRLVSIVNFANELGLYFGTHNLINPPFMSITTLTEEKKLIIKDQIYDFLGEFFVQQSVELGGNPQWQQERSRMRQRQRVVKSLKTVKKFMLSRDDNAAYAGKFREYEEMFNRAKGIEHSPFLEL